MFVEQACFHLPRLQVTDQCSVIGSDCQTVLRPIIKKPLAIKRCPPPHPTHHTALPKKIPFSFFESGRSCSSALSTSVHYKLNINIWKWAAFHIYQLISSFSWALVEVHPLLFCLCREMSLIIVAVHISGPKLLVHVKFNEELFDTSICMTQCRPGIRPLQTTQFTHWNEFCSHLLNGKEPLARPWLNLTFYYSLKQASSCPAPASKPEKTKDLHLISDEVENIDFEHAVQVFSCSKATDGRGWRHDVYRLSIHPAAVNIHLDFISQLDLGKQRSKVRFTVTIKTNV